MQEHRTAGIAAAWLRQQGYEVTEGVGGTGDRGLLRNGDGATVLLRAGWDSLPMQGRTGTVRAAGDSWEVTVFGRGAHGSMPQEGVDPVVMAAAAVMRLQTVVSREVAMTDSAVVTVGTLRAGMNENVIPDRALLRLNVRTFKDGVRARVLGSIRRILEAEANASGAPKPPDFSVLSEYP